MTVKRKKLLLFFKDVSFCIVCLTLLANTVAAQSDSFTYHSPDTGFTDEDSATMYEDSETADTNALDTTGKYFNWKENASDPYSSDKIKERVSSDSIVQRLRNEDDFWYVKSVESFKKNALRLRYDKQYRDSLKKEGLLPPDEEVFVQEPDSNAWYAQPWLYYFIWIVIIGVFVFAVAYFLLSNKINLFSRKSAKVISGEEETDAGGVTNDSDTLLQKYIREKNYRFAVRVLYLQLLKKLNEKEMIVFQPQFTNMHYLQQLYGSVLYPSFFTVTRHYEYIWYGEFAVTETSFQKIQSDFAKLKNEVNRR